MGYGFDYMYSYDNNQHFIQEFSKNPNLLDEKKVSINSQIGRIDLLNREGEKIDQTANIVKIASILVNESSLPNVEKKLSDTEIAYRKAALKNLKNYCHSVENSKSYVSQFIDSIVRLFHPTTIDRTITKLDEANDNLSAMEKQRTAEIQRQADKLLLEQKNKADLEVIGSNLQSFQDPGRSFPKLEVLNETIQDITQKRDQSEGMEGKEKFSSMLSNLEKLRENLTSFNDNVSLLESSLNHIRTTPDDPDLQKKIEALIIINGSLIDQKEEIEKLTKELREKLK